MRVHLRNVVYSALERGVVMGHHRVEKLSKHKQKNTDAVIDTMLKSIWESLDGIIDFTDEDDENPRGEGANRSRIIGFQPTDVIADTEIPTEEEEEADDEDGDDDDAIVPLDVLYRVHRVEHRRKR